MGPPDASAMVDVELTMENPAVRRTPLPLPRCERLVAQLRLAAQDQIWLFKPSGVPQP